MGDLVDNIDRIDLSMTKTDDNLHYRGNKSLGDHMLRDITNRLSIPKEQGTWKRRARYQVDVCSSENKVAYDPTQKRQLVGEGVEGVNKKRREVLLDHNMEKESSQAEVGDSQPRRSL